MGIAAKLAADGGLVAPECLPDGRGAKPQGLQFGNLVSLEGAEVGVVWHGNIVFLCDNKRISNPPTMLHLAPEFTPQELWPIDLHCERCRTGSTSLPLPTQALSQLVFVI